MLHAPDRVIKNVDNSPFSKYQLDILYAVGLYYNGTPFFRDNRNYSLRHTRPPSLQTLLDAPDDHWEAYYTDAMDALVDRGLLHGPDDPEYIVRTPVPWAPTRNGRAAIGDLFGETYSERYPDRIFHYHSGLVGDWEETLTHRTGVDLGHEYYYTLWRSKSGHEIGDDDPALKRYPGRGGTHPRADVHNLFYDSKEDRHHLIDVIIEVITDHNDRESLVSKAKWFQTQHQGAIWVFDDRETLVRSLSYLHEHDETDCQLVNAPYSNPENYSIDRIKDYLNRSRQNDNYCVGAAGCVFTIQELFDEVQEEHNPPHQPYPNAV